MKALLCLLTLALAVPAAGQTLTSAIHKEARQLAAHDPTRGHWEEQPIKSPTLVWLGIGMLGVGTLAVLGSLTAYQKSDLSQEQSHVRLNQHLAPCDTDPDETTLPIADCKPHYPLLSVGLALQGAGAGLILYGAQPVSRHPALTFRVRF